VQRSGGGTLDARDGLRGEGLGPDGGLKRESKKGAYARRFDYAAERGDAESRKTRPTPKKVFPQKEIAWGIGRGSTLLECYSGSSPYPRRLLSGRKNLEKGARFFRVQNAIAHARRKCSPRGIDSHTSFPKKRRKYLLKKEARVLVGKRKRLLVST